jgi:Bifunctional DNA primase/polymerase, N-terminal
MTTLKQHAPKTAPQPATTDIREHALEAARRGLSVFPLLPRRKEPRLQGWPDAATTDEAQINAWFDEQPDANYAILANEQACFIDVDPRNHGIETLARLEAEEPEFSPLFRTLTVETGRGDGGKHQYFRPPTGWKLRQGKDALGPGVDVALWHKYMVGPGSLHPDTGLPYRFVDPEVTIAPLPSWVILRLLEGLETNRERATGADVLSTLSGTRDTPLPPLSMADQTISQVRETVRGYQRDGLLTDEAYDRLYHDPVVQAAMLEFNGVPREAGQQAYSRERGISDRCLCPRPGHDEQHPSADVVFYKRHRVLKVRCHHGNSKPTGLPDLYAMRTTGVYRDLTKAELKLWTLRMLVDMGALDAAEVERRPLPDELPEGAPAGLREVYHAIVEVLSLRYLFGKEPAPLVRGFLARWAGLSERVIGQCLQWLLKHWYLKGGMFLRKDGTFSETREDKMSPECFVMRLSIPKRRKPGDNVKRSRKEWAICRAEQRDAEAIYWRDYEAAERSGELLDAADEARMEAERRGDFDDLDDWSPDLEPEFFETEDEPLDPEIMADIEAMESEVNV